MATTGFGHKSHDDLSLDLLPVQCDFPGLKTLGVLRSIRCCWCCNFGSLLRSESKIKKGVLYARGLISPSFVHTFSFKTPRLWQWNAFTTSGWCHDANIHLWSTFNSPNHLKGFQKIVPNEVKIHLLKILVLWMWVLWWRFWTAAQRSMKYRRHI